MSKPKGISWNESSIGSVPFLVPQVEILSGQFDEAIVWRRVEMELDPVKMATSSAKWATIFRHDSVHQGTAVLKMDGRADANLFWAAIG